MEKGDNVDSIDHDLSSGSSSHLLRGSMQHEEYSIGSLKMLVFSDKSGEINSLCEVLQESELKPLQRTQYQERLADRLLQLENIIFGDGAERGYAKTIGDQISRLRRLQQENPEEHDELIASNPQYQELLSIFPGWFDFQDRQAEYEKRDRGFLAALRY